MGTVKAKAAVFVGIGKPLEVREYPVLAPAAGMARLNLLYSGICGTDIHIHEGRLAIPPAFIPGHEFIGTVAALGAGVSTDGTGAPLAVGDTVVACVALPCGTCFLCKLGETASCLNFGVSFVRDPQEAPHFFGGFAEVLHQPASTLVRIPGGIDPAAAAAYPCAGPTAIRAFDFAGGSQAGELVVVQGTGPVGLFAVAYAAKAGCTVIAIGSGATPARLQMAKTLGADTVIDYRATSADERLKLVQATAAAMGRGNGADLVFEASGNPQAFLEGLNLVRTRGRYLVPGQYSASGTVAFDPSLLTFKAIRVVGSGQYKMCDISTYLEFLKTHPDLQTAFAASLTHTFPVAAATAAMRAVSGGDAVKGVFVP